MDELEVASERFAKPDGKYGFYSNLRRGQNTEPYDAGLVVIDLVARLVVVDSSYSAPGKSGTIFYHNGRCGTNKALRYHLADDWLFLRDGDNWRHIAEERRQERTARPRPDARKVFYGKPMLEFVARECFAAFARRDEIAVAVREQWAQDARDRLGDESNFAPDEIDAAELNLDETAPMTWPGQVHHVSPFYDALKQIHATWLLTRRDDLGGACPRDVAFQRRGHLASDLQDRCEQWSLMDQCPRGLDESCDAFMHGGFGTHELVEYYHLVRELLWSSWERLTELAQPPNETLTQGWYLVGDFLTTEIPRLERVREAWLDAPDPEMHGRTPRSIIARERARLPEVVSARDAMIDPDCPTCQMLAEMPGPMFWHLDGCSMDDDFAFDIYRHTREAWEEERRSWDEWSKRCDAERSARLGVSDSPSPEDSTGAI
jgi:hypothetical protein